MPCTCGFSYIGHPAIYKKGVINDSICDGARSFYGVIPFNPGQWQHNISSVSIVLKTMSLNSVPITIYHVVLVLVHFTKANEEYRVHDFLHARCHMCYSWFPSVSSVCSDVLQEPFL